MSNIWKLIKEGKEKLNAPKKEENDLEEDEDMLMFDQDKNSDNKNNSIVSDPLLEENKELPEWLTRDDIYEIRKLKDYPIFELHEELIRLEKWLQPTAFDKYARECVVDDLNALFEKENLGVDIYPFGSFLTNLCLPNSDLDVMIDCNAHGDCFKRIERIIRKSKLAKNVIAISHARVPIIKFKHIKTGIDVDISINQDSSLLTSAYVLRQLDRYPLLRSMTHIIKYMLTQRELNETFHGGVGSFMITLLCIGCEQWCIREGMEKGNLGNRLLQFFYYYGFVFNYEKLVLRVRGDGGYVTKEEKDWVEENKEFYLSVENPIDTSLDVGKSSYNIKRFKSFCSHALCKLTYNLNEAKAIHANPYGYFLQDIIRVEPRYEKSILTSEVYKKWGMPGMVVPDSEKRRQELIERHFKAVKLCDKGDLRKVYESDYNAFMNIQPNQSNNRNNNYRYSQKRSGGAIGTNKKYRRF